MVTIHEPRPLHAAIKTQLETTGKQIGLGKAPADPDPPYAVLYPLPDRSAEGSLSNPWQVATQMFQVTYVGDDMTEAQWMQEKARGVLLGWAPTVSGWSPGPVEMDLPNVIGQTDFDGPVFTLADRYSIYVS